MSMNDKDGHFAGAMLDCAILFIIVVALLWTGYHGIGGLLLGILFICSFNYHLQELRRLRLKEKQRPVFMMDEAGAPFHTNAGDQHELLKEEVRASTLRILQKRFEAIEGTRKRLEQLNNENYMKRSTGQDAVVSGVERALCKVETCLFGNASIQEKCYQIQQKKEESS